LLEKNKNMKKTHPSHYLMQLQLIMVTVLGAIIMIANAHFIIGILPGVLSLLALVFGALVLSRLGHMIAGDYAVWEDYIHGSSLPTRVYCPESYSLSS
jgi:hypothetical protein